MTPRFRRAARSAALLFPALAAAVFLARTTLALVAQDLSPARRHVLGPQDVHPAQSRSRSPGSAHAAQDQGPTARPFSVTARRYLFEPARIEVIQGDVVKIDLRTEDIAHSWTVDDYRIAKRVSPGQPVTFEFRADKAGTFPFYCNLQSEDGCRKMHGELVVKPRK